MRHGLAPHAGHRTWCVVHLYGGDELRLRSQYEETCVLSGGRGGALVLEALRAPSDVHTFGSVVPICSRARCQLRVREVNTDVFQLIFNAMTRYDVHEIY